MRDRKIPLFNKARYAFKLFEGHLSWTTWAFLLTIGGWLPVIFAGKEYARSVFYYTGPRVMGTIFNLASLSLVVSIILSLFLLPRKKEKFRFFKCKRASFFTCFLVYNFYLLGTLYKNTFYPRNMENSTFRIRIILFNNQSLFYYC